MSIASTHSPRLISRPVATVAKKRPESRIDEVLCNAYEWRLDKELVHQLEEAFSCFDFNMEPGEGLLLVHHENACHMQDDGGKGPRGLDAAGIRGFLVDDLIGFVQAITLRFYYDIVERNPERE